MSGTETTTTTTTTINNSKAQEHEKGPANVGTPSHYDAHLVPPTLRTTTTKEQKKVQETLLQRLMDHGMLSLS
jgi:hypothetical protein